MAIFGPTDPVRNGPWNPADPSLTRYRTCDCHYERQCRRSIEQWCLGTITEEEVRQAVNDRLNGTNRTPPAFAKGFGGPGQARRPKG